MRAPHFILLHHNLLSYPVKYVPAWVPGAKFQRQAKVWREASQKMLDLPFQMVRDKMVTSDVFGLFYNYLYSSYQSNGTAAPCFAATELEAWLLSDQNTEDYQTIKDVSAIIYAGGGDTVCSRTSSVCPESDISVDCLNHQLFLSRHGYVSRCSERST